MTWLLSTTELYRIGAMWRHSRARRLTAVDGLGLTRSLWQFSNFVRTAFRCSAASVSPSP